MTVLNMTKQYRAELRGLGKREKALQKDIAEVNRNAKREIALAKASIKKAEKHAAKLVRGFTRQLGQVTRRRQILQGRDGK